MERETRLVREAIAMVAAGHRRGLWSPGFATARSCWTTRDEWHWKRVYGSTQYGVPDHGGADIVVMQIRE